MWYNVYSQEARETNCTPMTTTPTLRGDKVLGEGSDHLARLEKFFEEISKNLLTNTRKCDTIRMSRGEKQKQWNGLAIQ